MLRLLFRLVALFARLLFYPLLRLRRSRAALPSGWIALELKGAVEDIAAPPRFWERRKSPSMSLHAMGELAHALAVDPRARGLVVTIRDARLGIAVDQPRGHARFRRDLLTGVLPGGIAKAVRRPVQPQEISLPTDGQFEDAGPGRPAGERLGGLDRRAL